MMISNDAQGENGGLGYLSKDQIDIIGEVSNISMGSAATALSNIIGKKVTITSPVVDVGSENTVEAIQRIPSIGVIISYTEGIVGKDILVIKKSDATEIVKVLMGGELPDEEEFGELHISAISEVMNQMMGAAATALAGFIGKAVNISPPDAFILTDENKDEKLSFILGNISEIVFVKFLFSVENMLESDIYMIMTHDFTDKLVNAMLEKMGISDISQLKSESSKQPEQQYAQPQQQYAQPQQQYAQPQQQYTQPMQNAGYGMGEKAQMQSAAMRAPVMPTAIHRAVLPDFDTQDAIGPDGDSNFELIQEVPLDLAVEVGRARKLVKEVMDFSVGTIIELDKQAGDPVDIIVNGQLLAHGEVVVIDESFGVRVTEIINKKAKRR
jgi:flagellar motor switch protein FliN/FliY